MKNIIESIEKGSGEGSTFFKVNDKYEYAIFKDKISKIEESKKEVKWDCGLSIHDILIYRGYDFEGNLLFEIESNSALTIIYKII